MSVSHDILVGMQRSPSVSAILDDSCWSKKLPNIEVFVAGKSDGPNQKALITARTALHRLESDVHQIMDDGHVSGIGSDWLLEEICVPYQLVDIYPCDSRLSTGRCSDRYLSRALIALLNAALLPSPWGAPNFVSET